ncbi:uncharacterized protein LOC128873491 [Hylaeus volcanicus]|uniref:uncharacterized protein LOC128873491 n=1 Tax=Hylaeus volcanicus TaxID=313075 RepID=UPI0023B7F8F8|nr:uncharacterized protein LOC128873491 [Hylaeus volcanicus]
MTRKSVNSRCESNTSSSLLTHSYSMQVLFFSLSWPHLIGAKDVVLKEEAATLDQIATASESVVQNGEKSKEKDKEFRDQLITSLIDTTVHYENSNGFVPMTTSSTSKSSNRLDQLEPLGNITWSNSLNDPSNSTIDDEDSVEQEDVDELENDPAYSTEARIFLNFPRPSGNNRRSFEYQTRQNDFELLKVRNDTPVVANYPDFYEGPPSSVESGNENTESSSRYGIKGKGKNLENYTGNYGTITDNNDESSSYARYYPNNSARDKDKAAREQEKVLDNYHQQDVFNYDGHGQSGQSGPIASSFPRTDQEVNDLEKSNSNSYDAYASIAASSQQTNNHHRFSRPVVVAEFGNSPIVSGSGGENYETSRVLHNRDGRFRSEEDSRDLSDEDYMEYTERPRRVQKNRRRPSSGDSSKRLQKEHRGSVSDSTEYESHGKRHHSSRTKSRQRMRGNSWMDDDRHRDEDDSYEETRYDSRQSGLEARHKSHQSSKFNPSNTWNQISPNLEISHSSGVEIGQLEKPKFLVPVKVNLVPVANFDHSSAMGSSQGFDVSNAVVQNLVSATPVSTVSSPTGIGDDSKLRVSTSAPDVVVGQNSFHNSMQAVFPQVSDSNKFSTNLKPQYVSSTVSPVFAVTPNVNPLQSIPIHSVHGTATPRTTYQVHGGMPQLIVPQPTHQTVPTLMQTPIQSNPDFNIQVNPHGMHGQNLVSHGNLQVQNIPTMSTITSTPQTLPVTKINLVTAESQNKKDMISGSTANFLASATMAVGQNDQRQLNGNSYYLQNSNTQQIVKPQVQTGLYQQNVVPKTKTYIQTTHLLPAVLQPMPTLTTFAASTPQLIPDHQNVQGGTWQNQQFVKVPHTGVDNGISTLRNIKLPSLTYPTMDNTGSQSINNVNALNTFQGGSGGLENAHLPYVGTRNVEIVNPNIKPSPVDTIINSYGAMHYPAAVFTTPFPMFTTTSVVTARPALVSTTDSSSNVQNFVNSLTEIGSKNQDSYNDMKTYQSQDRPVFNPINFVPNVDVMKNQNALNSKLHASEPLPQNLNLVPLLPGGNFFKPSFDAQSELLTKPKLNTDLATYAEQMFKESLKTIYNSQKWNNDRKPGHHRHNASDAMDIAKLKNELQRLKASLSDSKRIKDVEAHHSETKPQTAELTNKKPDELLAALEQMLKAQSSDSTHSYHGSGRPHRHRRPSDQDKFTFGPNSDFRDTKHVRDFMKPPHSGSHRSKGHFHDKPGKKRPMSGPPRFNGPSHFHGPRPYPRHTFSPKTSGPETSATNIDTIHAESSPFEQLHDTRHRRPDFKKGSIDSFSSFASSPTDKNIFLKGYEHHKGGKEGGINHPRMHNFFGLLMKNKQLPNGLAPNYFQDKDQLKQFFEDETLRSQQQYYDDTLRDYFNKMSESALHSNLRNGHDTRRYLTQKRTV